MGADVGVVPGPVRTRDAEPSPGWANRGWVVAATALLIIVLVDVLRVWLPSLVHLSTVSGVPRAPGALGGFALLWIAAGAAAIPLLRRLGPGRLWRGAVIALALSRLTLQFLDGGAAQLWLTSVAVLLATVALAALAAGAPSGQLARLGIAVGLAGATWNHLVLATHDLVWRDGLGATVLVAVTVGGLVWAAERARAVPLWWPTAGPITGDIAPVWTRGAAWPWLAVGPSVALVGMLVAVPARTELAVGWPLTQTILVASLAGGLSVLAAASSRWLGGGPTGAIGAVVVLLSTVLALQPVGGTAVAGQFGVLVGIGFVLGATGVTPADSGPRRRAGAAVGSMVLFWAITFAYFASYEIAIPVSNRVWLVVAAAGIAAVGVAAAVGARGFRRGGPPWRMALSVTAIAVLLGGIGALTAPEASDAVGTTSPHGALRVATYNVQSGYGVDGRFDPDALAATLRDERVDLVVLNEVDRGWLLQGGHDVLRLVADRLGMPHTAFAPGADAVWGNAVLSRLPLDEVRTEQLPRGGAAMPRSWVSVTLQVGERRVGLVGTQLHQVASEPAVRLAQARSVAAEVSRLRGRDLPIVLLGDLGAERGDPELEPLEFLEDAARGAGPTVPAQEPTRRVDHVLVTGDLVGRDATVPESTASGNRPLVVTLEVDGTG